MNNFFALTRMRIQLTMRNKMFLFFSVIMPFGFFFLYSSVFSKGLPKVVTFFLGPVIALTVMGSFWGLSAGLVLFREQGILRRFHVTPVTAVDMLASSIVANYVLTLPTVLIQLFFARFLYHVTNFGNVFGLFLFVTVGTIAFSALGLVVASVTNTMQETQVINQLIWLPLIFLSGATVPFSSLSKVVQEAGVFLPATYLVRGLQAGIYNNTSATKLLLELGVLALWAILTFTVSAQLFRWEAETKIPRKAKLIVLATAIPFLLLGLYESRTGHLQAEAEIMWKDLQNPSAVPNSSAPDASSPSEQQVFPH